MIVYADDQYINRQMLKMTFYDIGLSDRLKIFANGKEVLTFFDTLLEDLSFDSTDKSLLHQPVALLILDINMPIYNGLETSTLLKKKFKKYNINQSAKKMSN